MLFCQGNGSGQNVTGPPVSQTGHHGLGRRAVPLVSGKSLRGAPGAQHLPEAGRGEV